jgi:hypothetical protein
MEEQLKFYVHENLGLMRGEKVITNARYFFLTIGERLQVTKDLQEQWDGIISLPEATLSSALLGGDIVKFIEKNIAPCYGHIDISRLYREKA